MKVGEVVWSDDDGQEWVGLTGLTLEEFIEKELGR